MNPFIWLALALGFIAVSSDDEKESPAPSVPSTGLKPFQLPEGTLIEIDPKGNVVVPEKLPLPTVPKPPPPPPKPPAYQTPSPSSSVPELVQTAQGFVPFLPILDDVIDIVGDTISDTIDYFQEDDEEYYEDDDIYYDDEEYYEDDYSDNAFIDEFGFGVDDIIWAD